MTLKDSKNIHGGAPRLLNHLTDEEIALCAHEMVKEAYPCSISQGIHEHLNICKTCYTKTLDFYNLIHDDTSVKIAFGLEQSTAKESISQWGDGFWRHVKEFAGRYKWFVAIAASIMLLAVVLLYSLVMEKPSAEKLFHQYHSPYQDIITSKSTGNDQQLLRALFFYNTGNYKRAIALFTDGLENHPGSDDYLFYLAGSYLAHGSYPEAVATFLLLQDSSSKYYIPSKWYLALSYLAVGNKYDSKVLLQNICDDGGFYATNSCEILKRLGKH